MQLYVDDAHVDKIRELMDVYPVDGVTTNPTILSRAGRPPMEALHEIRALIGDERTLMTQAVSTEAERMADEAAHIADELGRATTYVKLPGTPQGIKAVKLAKRRDPELKLCVTAVYSVGQAFLAAQAGADCVAPYIGRIDNLGASGVRTTEDIYDLYQAQGLDCFVAGASFKTAEQVYEVARHGIQAAAIPSAVWDVFLANQCVDHAVDVFTADFEGLVGPGKTFLDL